VVAARRRDAALRDVPVVVRERDGSRDIVRAASVEAREQGVKRGIRRREAEARCPGAVIVDADPALEARTFEIVARAVETLTPRVVLDRPGRCAFPTRGPARYFGGDEPLAARVRATVAAVLDGDAAPERSGGARRSAGRAGASASDTRARPERQRVEVCVGIADGEFAARLAARRDAVLERGGSAAFLAPWPVSVLEDDELASLLIRLGVPTLGALAALPGDAVLARFGNAGRAFHDLARGLDTGPPVLVAPPPDLVEQVELDPPATRVDVAAFAAKGLADRLLSRLAERGLACTRVVIEAETEHGERMARTWRHDGALTPGALGERVRWQLDGWLTATNAPKIMEGDVRAAQDAAAFADAGLESTTGALVLVRLVPDEVVPADGRQLGFWGGDQAARDRADRALTRVQGMLGYDAVTTAVVQGGRTPAEQVRWVPWGEPRAPKRPLAVGTEVPGWPGAVPPPFPARVYDPPVAAELLDEHGAPVVVSGRGEASAAPARLQSRVVSGAVRAHAGPWAHDVRWWDAHERKRQVLWQVVLDTGVACLVRAEGGTTGIEAIYD
jgi:protein ImuB